MGRKEENKMFNIHYGKLSTLTSKKWGKYVKKEVNDRKCSLGYLIYLWDTGRLKEFVTRQQGLKEDEFVDWEICYKLGVSGICLFEDTKRSDMEHAGKTYHLLVAVQITDTWPEFDTAIFVCRDQTGKEVLMFGQTQTWDEGLEWFEFGWEPAQLVHSLKSDIYTEWTKVLFSEKENVPSYSNFSPRLQCKIRKDLALGYYHRFCDCDVVER